MSALKPCPRSIQVGEFEVAISGGVWVAIRVHKSRQPKKVAFSLLVGLSELVLFYFFKSHCSSP